MKSFLDLCQNRRSYRQYTSEPISRDHIDYILRCALMSPAGKRLNPWRFTVVTNPSVLRQFVGCRTYGSGMFQTAQAGIVISLDTSLCDTWMADGAIAASHILLAASDLGLGACWCHVYQREGAEALVKQLTGIDEAQTVLCIISLGHKNEERKPFDLDKLQYDKVSFVE